MKGNMKVRKLGKSAAAVIWPKQGRRRRWLLRRNRERKREDESETFFIFYDRDFLYTVPSMFFVRNYSSPGYLSYIEKNFGVFISGV